MILLTIVTITKGDPAGLGRTLASASEFRCNPAVEHLVVDGDGSARPAAEAAGCRWCRQYSQGIAGAFNEGLRAVRGEWIWFLNGGDTLHPELAWKWLLAFLRASAADVVAGTVHYNGEAAPQPHRLLREQWPPLISWIPHPGAIVRRRVLFEFGGFDQRWSIATDFELWLRLLYRDTRVDVVSVPFACFDITGVSQRAETQGALARENASVIWLHKWQLLRAWLITTRRTWGTLWRAWRQR